MTEKETEEDLPPSYSSLDYDSEPVSRPSVTEFHEEPKDEEHSCEQSAPLLPPTESEPSSVPLVYNPPNLVFEDIYEATCKYADKHCCYGKRFLHRMKLLDIMNETVFYYNLESFGEKRKSEKKSSPYTGEPLDGSENGQAPDPWDVTVLPPELFNDCNVTTKIPHTDVIRKCSRCNGVGDFRCEPCDGKGHRTCEWCDGRGRGMFFRKCTSCHGDGIQICWSCSGVGRSICGGCNGYKKIKHWKVLHVTWRNNSSEYYTDVGYLPVNLIRNAKGVELLKKEDVSVEAITNAPDTTVNIASKRILESHQNSFSNEMIIRQRHVLRAVPLTRIRYEWNQEDGEFYVYDIDRKVYFEDYPQKYCCCTCS